MKYFLDTEFIEGMTNPLLRKSRHFIHLISIGIVREDGKEYYAISRDFNPKKANQWVKDNVIAKLPDKDVSFNESPRRRAESLLWKHENTISFEIKEFFGCVFENNEWKVSGDDKIEVYGYFSDYDWVVFCSLFGAMIDLPKGFPMFCMDLKQMMVERNLSKEWKQKVCPDPIGEHNALVDAKWNRELYNQIISYSTL